MLKEKKFTILDETIKADITENDLYITGIANTGERDLVGDIITESALNDIKDQAINRNLHLNHETVDLDGIIGVIVESEIIPDGLLIKARILKRFRDTLTELLNEGVKFGLSVAGKAHYEENSYENIVKWDLTEISLTPTPCDLGTMGTVNISKSFNEFINSLSLKGDKMVDENYLTEDQVIELINTAFNEKESELLETIRKEYETELNEIKNRLEVIENTISSENQEDQEGQEGQDGQENQDDQEDKTNQEDQENQDDQEDKTNQDDEENQEDQDKKFDQLVDKKVEEKIKNIFGNPTPSFNYNSKSSSTPEDKKEYTPRQIAKMIMGSD